MRKPFLLVVLGLATLDGCATHDRVEGPSSATASPVMSASPAATTASEERERVIHLMLRFQVASLRDGTSAVRTAITEQGGYIASANEEARAAMFEARIPVAQLAAFRVALRDVGTIFSSVEEARDVTTQHRDLSAQLVGARAEEARLVALMQTNTTQLADVLAVERELARVSTSIGQLEASERSLVAQIALAQVSVTLVQDSPDFGENPLAMMEEAAAAGMLASRNLALGGAALFLAVAPSAALLSCLLWLLFLLLRHAARLLGARFAVR